MREARHRAVGHDLALRDPLHLAERYGGWVSRELIGFYERYVRTLFSRYGSKVKYWLTFNEIDSVLHLPFLSDAIDMPKEQPTDSQLYQAAHHELVPVPWRPGWRTR